MTTMSLMTVVLATLAIMNEGSPICHDPPHIINMDHNINPEDITKVDIPPEYIKTRRFWVSGNTSCKAESNRYGDQQHCPVYYVLNTDVNRVPRHQYEQICSCSSPPTSERGVSLVECKAVISYMPVKRRIGCGADGLYNYTFTLEAFQTGCEAVQPNIRYVPSDTPKSPQ